LLTFKLCFGAYSTIRCERTITQKADHHQRTASTDSVSWDGKRRASDVDDAPASIFAMQKTDTTSEDEPTLVAKRLKPDE
jgi:hypothetical protein